jgi:hypothetical protein
MNEPSREQLLGYLLGALDAADHEQVEAEIDHDPQLRADLDRLSACVRRMGLDSEPRHYDPPAGLAERTCQFVAVQTEPLVTRAAALSSYYGAEQQRRMSWYDWVTAAAVLIIAASLFFPAVSHSRFQAQIASCQNHLRLIGQAMHEFSESQPDGSFPGPAADGNRAAAGVVASLLVANQFADSPMFLCPGSQERRRVADFRVALPEELDAATGPELAAMQRTMGGDYGYSLGYVVDGKLQPPQNLRRGQFVLVADAPSDMQMNRVSFNHCGRGQNVLYEDGHVQFIKQIPNPQLTDDPYHNREGWVSAGLDREDAVLGASGDHPLPITLINDRGPSR